MTALAGVELESLVSEPDALTTRGSRFVCFFKQLFTAVAVITFHSCIFILGSFSCSSFLYTANTSLDGVLILKQPSSSTSVLADSSMARR